MSNVFSHRSRSPVVVVVALVVASVAGLSAAALALAATGSMSREFNELEQITPFLALMQLAWPAAVTCPLGSGVAGLICGLIGLRQARPLFPALAIAVSFLALAASLVAIGSYIAFLGA